MKIYQLHLTVTKKTLNPDDLADDLRYLLETNGYQVYDVHGNKIIENGYEVSIPGINQCQCHAIEYQADVPAYTYSILWLGDEKEYVGLCNSFPSMSWIDKTPELALAGIRKLVEENNV